MFRDKAYLKSRFQNGDKPTEDDFADLIDSCHAQGTGAPALEVIPITGANAGNVMFDTAFQNITVQAVCINGGWSVLANGLQNTGAGTINFTSYGGLADGDLLVVKGVYL